MIVAVLGVGILILVVLSIFAKLLIDKRTEQTQAADPIMHPLDDPKPEAAAAAVPAPAQAQTPDSKPADFGPREPNLKWKQDPAPVKDGKAGVMVKISVDRDMYIPAFWAGCDRACETEGVSLRGTHREQPLKSSNPDVALLSLLAPRPLERGVEASWEIRAKKGADPFRILTVQMMSPDQVPQN
jgi:hypothetical protein